MQEAKDGKPGTPQYHFIQILDIHHTKDEYKLVENKVPELVSQILKS